MSARLYHGGLPGLAVGGILRPGPPHVEDGCPVCRARAEGRTLRVWEFRAWALSIGGPQAAQLLRAFEGAPDQAPIDPPSERQAVFVTSSLTYATWYAARSRGDLYRVQTLGPLTASQADHFPTWTTPEAKVVEVIRRGVFLLRRDRRALSREWARADKAATREARS